MWPFTLERAVRARVHAGCWISAAGGIAIVQMLLLSQGWHQGRLATPTACIASAWLIGALVAGQVTSAPRVRVAPLAPVWGALFLCCAVAWRIWSRQQAAVSPSPSSAMAAVSLFPLLGAGLLLGLLSALWLSQPRAWANAGERSQLARQAACLTFGLVMAWRFLAFADLTALACVVPLLLLDPLTTLLDPRAGWRGVAASLLERQANPGLWPLLRLERRYTFSDWYRTYLRERKITVATLLASGTTILVGAVWNTIPTPFAAGLARTGEMNKLLWLLAGQLGALATGAFLLTRGRGLLGSLDRLIPPPLRTIAWRLAWCSLALMACGLALLGLPSLQASWWLGLSLSLYTIAALAWGMLLPRLRPSIGTEISAQRHLAFGQGAVLRESYLAYERAIEERVNRVLRTGEGILTAGAIPIAGLLIDHTTVDVALIVAGLTLAWFLGTVLIANSSQTTEQLFSRPALVGIAWHRAKGAAWNGTGQRKAES
jgi:hypothetical protein